MQCSAMQAVGKRCGISERRIAMCGDEAGQDCSRNQDRIASAGKPPVLELKARGSCRKKKGSIEPSRH